MNLTRRTLLGGAAAAALASRAQAAAVFLAGGPVAGSGFNGGRSQLNFNFLGSGGEYPFINAMKTAQTWQTGDSTSQPIPTILDSNGYPTSISNQGVKTFFTIPSSTDRPGNWRLKWTGTGTLRAPGLGQVTATNGDYTFAPGTVSAYVWIVDGTNVTDVRFFHADDEADLDAGNVFTAHFKSKLAEGKFGVLRFLNWQLNNTTNVRYWADRKPVGYAFYSGAEMRSSIYGGTTTNSANDYSVAAPSGWAGLVDKAIVTVKFNATATAGASTLNVNGTGAKAILNPSGVAITDAQTFYFPTSGSVGTLIYDADLNGWVKYGGDPGTQYGYLNNGAPPELLLQLCVEVGAHPWFCPPFLACDPITDWITGLATYCRNNAPSWMIPRFEACPNETWNSAAGFLATPYAWKKAFAHWGALAGATDDNDWVGKVASLQGQAVSAVYADDRTKYQSIVGVQTFGSAAPNARLNSTLYVSQDGGSAAKNWVTHVAVANYFRDTYTDAQRGTAAIAYAGGDLTQPGLLVDSCTSNTPADSQHQFSLPAVALKYASFRSWAVGLGVNGFTCYEGGWSPDYVTTSVGGATSTQINNLYAASKAVAALQTYTTTNYNNFVAAGGLFPSCFQFAGAANVWSVFDPDIYATPSTQWAAIVAFNA